VDKYHFLLDSAAELERLTRDDATAYELTRASGILRLLFLDSQPLVHQVNRDLRMPMVFKISHVKAGYLSKVVPGTSMHYTSTTSKVDGAGVNAKLPEFLAHPTIAVQDELFTVRNVIKCVAHVGGGVHYLPPLSTTGPFCCMQLRTSLVQPLKDSSRSCMQRKPRHKSMPLMRMLYDHAHARTPSTYPVGQLQTGSQSPGSDTRRGVPA
jgi:hypothetical protein